MNNLRFENRVTGAEHLNALRSNAAGHQDHTSDDHSPDVVIPENPNGTQKRPVGGALPEPIGPLRQGGTAANLRAAQIALRKAGPRVTSPQAPAMDLNEALNQLPPEVRLNMPQHAKVLSIGEPTVQFAPKDMAINLRAVMQAVETKIVIQEKRRDRNNNIVTVDVTYMVTIPIKTNHKSMFSKARQWGLLVTNADAADRLTQKMTDEDPALARGLKRQIRQVQPSTYSNSMLRGLVNKLRFVDPSQKAITSKQVTWADLKDVLAIKSPEDLAQGVLNMSCMARGAAQGAEVQQFTIDEHGGMGDLITGSGTVLDRIAGHEDYRSAPARAVVMDAVYGIQHGFSGLKRAQDGASLDIEFVA